MSAICAQRPLSACTSTMASCSRCSVLWAASVFTSTATHRQTDTHSQSVTRSPTRGRLYQLAFDVAVLQQRATRHGTAAALGDGQRLPRQRALVHHSYARHGTAQHET